jgi:hypothetical protein
MKVEDKRRVDHDGNSTGVEIAPQLFDIEPRGSWVLVRKYIRTEAKLGDVVLPGEGTPGFEARSQRGTVVRAPEKTGLVEGDLVLYTNFPMDIPDIEDLTGEKNVHLVLDEEIYARFRPCQP